MGTPNYRMIEISRIKTNPRNARAHPKKQIRKIASVMFRTNVNSPEGESFRGDNKRLFGGDGNDELFGGNHTDTRRRDRDDHLSGGQETTGFRHANRPIETCSGIRQRATAAPQHQPVT